VTPEPAENAPSRPATPRVSVRDVLLALSLANLLFLEIWLELLAVSTTGAYFLDISITDVTALMANVLLLAGLLLGATVIARRFGARGRTLIISGFVLLLNFRISGIGPELAPGVLALVDRWKNGLHLEVIGTLLLLLGIAAASVRWPQRALKIAVGTVYILAPLVALTYFRATWILATIDPTDALAAEAPEVGAPVVETTGPRVVVIVMDALSRHHSIDARPDGFALPELDRLRATAIDASQVTQISPRTLISVPAMLTGLAVTESDPTADDELALTVNGEQQTFSTTPNLFSAAQQLGGVAIVVGWYHPYCRMFEALDGCSTFPTRTIGSRGRQTGFFRAMRDQQLALIPYVNLRIKQIKIVQAQREDAVEAVTLGRRGLVFLHLVLPHTPWIWDDEAGTFTLTNFDPDGYYDNMRLMDRVLGELRRAMEGANEWDSTAVLLLSDHRMRYRPAYLKEPADPRVPFILKLPGQTAAVAYDNPFNAMVTHDLVLALLRGELKTPREATAWLDAR
jgi:hypothetical protein